MVAQLLAKHIGIPVEQVESFLHMSHAQIYASPDYYELVKTLDYDLLVESLNEVRRVYEQHLPGLASHLRDQHGYLGRPMTAYTLGNWLIGFLNQPHLLFKLVDIHRPLSPEIIETSLPAILEILGKMANGAHEWQRATALLSLPLCIQD